MRQNGNYDSYHEHFNKQDLSSDKAVHLSATCPSQSLNILLPRHRCRNQRSSSSCTGIFSLSVRMYKKSCCVGIKKILANSVDANLRVL